METPYGELPDRFVKDMTVQEMHDFLRARSRRPRGSSRGRVVAGAVILGAAVAGPVLWRRSFASASIVTAPRWVAYGADPATQMYISWSLGTHDGVVQVPPAPQVRWGLDESYGNVEHAYLSGVVPVPCVPGEPTENTTYNHALLDGLRPNATYHYSVSDDGVHWSRDATFTTAEAGPSDFRFTIVGDQSVSTASSQRIAELIAAYNPRFNVVVGDLAYGAGTGRGFYSPAYRGGQISDASAFSAGEWDRYLGIVGPAAAGSIPWSVSVGNHEMEPLDAFGYAGFLTRFPQAYAPEREAGSPVVKALTYGNVAVIQLDANDLSAELADNNGYTEGRQTVWLEQQLAAYRRADSGIDWIVVGFHNCMYCSNRTHGSDVGIRSVWEPLFDRYRVDLVVNGHVHAYERTYPIKAGVVNTEAGTTYDPTVAGVTYILAGGGGQALYRGWYGPTGGGDPATEAGLPFASEWLSGGTALGADGGATAPAQQVPDSVTGYSAFRKADWSFIVLDVTAPSRPGGETTIRVRAIDPRQSDSEITAISNPVVMDAVTLTKRSGIGALRHIDRGSICSGPGSRPGRSGPEPPGASDG